MIGPLLSEEWWMRRFLNNKWRMMLLKIGGALGRPSLPGRFLKGGAGQAAHGTVGRNDARWRGRGRVGSCLFTIALMERVILPPPHPNIFAAPFLIISTPSLLKSGRQVRSTDPTSRNVCDCPVATVFKGSFKGSLYHYKAFRSL